MSSTGSLVATVPSAVHLEVSASRFSTKAARCSSATPRDVQLVGEALLEAVAALHVDGSMPLSDSLARRRMVGLLVAMSAASS